MILNIVVDAVVRAILDVVCGPQKAQNGLVWAAGEQNLIFYADNGRILGREHMWVQDALSLAVAMFHRMELETNLEKTNNMVWTPGFIWGKWGEQEYKIRATGKGATFWE